MTLNTLLKIFADKKCQKVYVKKLSANDNSKNQVYFGGSFDILNILPSSEIMTDADGKRKRESFKSKLDFYWVNEEGNSYNAPYSQLILYPDYPEVRFSGFLLGCKNAPSDLMNSRLENRILFLGVSNDKKIYGFVIGPEAELAKEFLSHKNLESHGVFNIITIVNGEILSDTRSSLLSELKRIHDLGWICSKRLTPSLKLVPCESTNCGGYTLEAELNIASNSKSAPDFLGWEVKQFGVTSFDKFGSRSISLMDHSPTGGYFNKTGAEAFIKEYGYPDRMGRPSRINFGGVHRNEVVHKLTTIKLIIEGFDPVAKKIINTDGHVALIYMKDKKEKLAASWSFSSLIKHWIDKHPKACYVPSKVKSGTFDKCNQKYSYGNRVILGSYTDVTLFLYQLYLGNISYDPGIKLEMAIEGKRKKNVKVRSLFRIKPINLSALYHENEIVDINHI